MNLRKIAVLDQHTIDKIAAGEVVERPSSVVKELVENAIDAGATAVTVEIADGGKKLIRITDNGGGMERDQVPLAFLRHATSKIEKVEDLEHIASLGFRGEALSSIAAVSQVELITKTPSALSGVRYVINGGTQETLEDMGAPEGTTFLVRNLFYNTPARSKFLKSDITEGNYISVLMEQLALSHPEISFKYIQNKQVKLHTSGNYNVKDVIYNIYGRDITKALLDVSYSNEFMKIEGFVGKPEISRGNRNFENYYINGRYVKNRIISKAIEDAYKGFMMQHKFPFVSLHITMEGNDLDVNVHPSKMEVRFARGAEVYDAVFETVRKALTKREMIPQVTIDEESKQKARQVLKPGDVPEPFEVKRREQLYKDVSAVREQNIYGNPKPFTKEEEKLFEGSMSQDQGDLSQKKQTVSSESNPVELAKTHSDKEYGKLHEESKTYSGKKDEKLHEAPSEKIIGNSSVKSDISEELHENPKTKDPVIISKNERNIPLKSTTFSEETGKEFKKQPAPPKQLELFEEKLLSPQSRSRHHLIGQIFDTYWLVQFEDNFYIIDQHAAHEKVYYERFVKKFREQTIESQYLSPPLIVSLNLQEEALLQANKKYFCDFGFEIEPFGGREYCISAVPSNLYGLDEETAFLEMLDHLAGEGEKDALSIFASRLATMACKAAVKGNHQMSHQEADQLIDELLTLENPYHCPHGRPTIISMTRGELEKKFKRIV